MGWMKVLINHIHLTNSSLLIPTQTQLTPTSLSQTHPRDVFLLLNHPLLVGLILLTGLDLLLLLLWLALHCGPVHNQAQLHRSAHPLLKLKAIRLVGRPSSTHHPYQEVVVQEGAEGARGQAGEEEGVGLERGRSGQDGGRVLGAVGEGDGILDFRRE